MINWSLGSEWIFKQVMHVHKLYLKCVCTLNGFINICTIFGENKQRCSHLLSLLWLNSLAQPLRPNKSFFDAEQENDIIVESYSLFFQYKKEKKTRWQRKKPAALIAWITTHGNGRGPRGRGGRGVPKNKRSNDTSKNRIIIVWHSICKICYISQ